MRRERNMSLFSFAPLLCIVLLFQSQIAFGTPVNTDKLIEAIQKKSLDLAAKELSKQDMDTNQPDSKGRLPIVEAAKTGDVRMVDAVIQFGALVKAKDPVLGKTALHVACNQGHVEIVKMLLTYGAEPQTTDKAGKKACETVTNKEIQQFLALYEKDGPIAFEDTPGTWIRAHSKGEGSPMYWFNVRTNDSRWNTPTSAAWHRIEIQGMPSKYINVVTGQETTKIPQALSWRKLRANGRELWYNWAINITQIDKPEEMPERLLTEAEGMLNARWYNTKTGQYSFEDPRFHSPWRAVKDEEGRMYYYNVVTAESVWDLPTELAWVEDKSEQHGGIPYYFNKKTGESLWEKPEHLAWEFHDDDL